MATSTPEAVTTTRGDSASRWIGEDDRGVELEIIAVEQFDHETGELLLLVIHVMPTALRKGKQP